MIVYIILLKFRAFGDNGGIDLTDSLTEKAICLVLTALPPHYFKKINRAKRIVGRLRQPPQEQMLFNPIYSGLFEHISKNQRGHIVPPLNILGLGGVRVPILFGNHLPMND